MRVLFDNSTPRGVTRGLRDHTVTEARGLGWDRLKNGELLKAAEEASFEVFVTADQNIRYQQNLTQRKIALVVLGNGRWTIVKRHIAEIASAIDAATLGSYHHVDMENR
ncbi:MAG TPA: hypothetical protein VFL96_02650 [Acidobacteriaceae bacterium]|nr:hypothetical protein [Acidobacteriaceae bacterium]